MAFPLLSDVVAEDMDTKVVEDEIARYGRVLRIARDALGKRDDLDVLPGHLQETRPNARGRKGAGRRSNLDNYDISINNGEEVSVMVRTAASTAAIGSRARPSYAEEEQEENENEDSTEDSAMIEASQESDMVD